eukprot:2086321-Pyramimonas_sp.AAC.1
MDFDCMDKDDLKKAVAGSNVVINLLGQCRTLYCMLAVVRALLWFCNVHEGEVAIIVSCQSRSDYMGGA